MTMIYTNQIPTENKSLNVLIELNRSLINSVHDDVRRSSRQSGNNLNLLNPAIPIEIDILEKKSIYVHLLLFDI